MKLLSIIVMMLTVLMQSNSYCQLDTSKKKIVYWIHGVNGNTIPTWDLYDNYFSSLRNMYSFKSLYPSDRSIDSVAIFVQEKIDSVHSILMQDTTLNQEAVIAISGSMGGLVTRAIEYQNRTENRSQSFNRIITINTPNRGASFFAAIKDGGTKKLVENVLDNSAIPILSSLTPLIPYFSLARSRVPLDGIMLPLDTSISTLSSICAEAFVREALYKRYNASIFDNMTESSSFLTKINNASQVNDTIPTISLVGTSPFPSVYRMLYTTLIHNAYKDSLDQHNDQGLAKMVNIIAGVYRTLGGFCLSFGSIPLSSLQTPQTILSTVENVPLAMSFFKGAKAIEKDFPNGVSVLISSAKTQFKVLGQKVIKEQPAEDGLLSFRFETDGRVVTERIEPDDGALSRTQQTHPNRPTEDVFEISNVNHNGAINNRAVRLQLERIFERDSRFRIYRK